MHKTAERAVIQYLRKKGLAPKDIHAGMVATLLIDAPLYAPVKGGWQNLSVADSSSRMTPGLEDLSLSLLPK